MCVVIVFENIEMLYVGLLISKAALGEVGERLLQCIGARRQRLEVDAKDLVESIQLGVLGEVSRLSTYRA